MGAVPVAHRPLRRLRHHRAPPSGVVLARDRVGPARRRRTSRCGRPSTTAKRRRTGSGWSFTDAVASWSWPGFEGQPVTVEVYADADEVELLVNGEPVGRAPAGDDARVPREFETTYTARRARRGRLPRRRGDRSDVAGVARSGPVLLDVRVDRAAIDADDRDLAYVEITLVDADGTRAPRRGSGRDRRGRRPGRAPGTRQRQPVHRGDLRRADARHVRRSRARGGPADRCRARSRSPSVADGCDDRTVTVEAR